MSISGTIAAAFTLYFTGGNIAAASAAYTIGAAIDTVINPTKINNEGPRLSDLSIQISSYGAAIPILYGDMRFTGNVIWSTNLLPTETTTHPGKGGPKVSNTTTSYAISCAIAFCEGEKALFDKLWMDSQLHYSIGPDADAATIIASNKIASGIRFYPGSEDQMPDPLIESIEGIGNASAFRGTCYIVFENLQLAAFGNRLPQIAARIISTGTPSKTYANICSLTDVDAGDPTLRGRSWITDRKIYLWRIPAAFVYNTIDVFESLDGLEKTFLGPLPLPTVNTYGEPYPVNSRDQFVLEVAEVTSDGHQQLRLMFPYTVVGDEVGTPSRVYPVPQIASDGYHQLFDNYRMTAYDEDSLAVAYAVRSDIGRYFGERITIFGAAGIFEYLIRSPMAAGPPTVCALAAAAGRVYALVFDGSTINLHVISQSDGSIEVIHPGPPGLMPSAGTGILDCMRTDGASVWAWVTSGAYVVKWMADGSSSILATNINLKKDDGTIINALGGQQCFISDDHVIMQGQEFANTDSSHPIYRHQLIHWNAASTAAVSLPSVTDNLCARRGVASSSTELNGFDVPGFLVSKQMSAKAALDFLASVYGFSGIDDYGTLAFRKRGTAPVCTITVGELAAHDFGATPDDAFAGTRGKETALPAIVNVNFSDPANDYQAGSVPSRRLNTTSQQIITMDVTALAMDPTTAARLALTAELIAWVERSKNAFATNYTYKYLQAADVVLIDLGDVILRVRITKVTDQAGLLQFECVADDANVFDQTVTASGPQRSSAIVVPAATALQILDIPMLRDADNSLGPYAAVDANATTWPGAVIEKSADDVLFASQTQLSSKTVLGFATTALGAPGPGNTFDSINSVTVNIGTDTLSSFTSETVLSGNATPYLIGREIVYACTATLVSTGVYRLSNFLRGLRGTERFKSGHAAGDRFVVLQPAGMRKLSDDVSDLNVPRYYRAITFGRDASTADEVTVRDTGQALSPFAPVDLRVDYGTSPITLSWHRRSRFSGRFLAPMQPPLGEATEQYEIDLKTAAGALMTTLTAYVPSVSLTTYVAGYTATVYQLSAIVGRGQGITITL